MSTRPDAVLQPRDETPLSSDQLWSMGAVTRRTGISEHTLRAWERRFGFPDPVRLPSGHRRYRTEDVDRLLLIRAALDAGHRAGDVLPLPAEKLTALAVSSDQPPGPLAAATPSGWLEAVLGASFHLDRAALAGALQAEAARLGTMEFLRDRVEPLLVEVGEAWARGELGVRHEHLLSEALEDQLRSLRARLEPTASGRPVVLATLPNEHHRLGLQVAALVVAATGRSQRLLGPRTPVDELVAAATAADAAAVGISVSVSAAGPESSALVTTLRQALPEAVDLWIGGRGGPMLDATTDRVVILPTLGELEQRLASLAE